MEGRAFFMHDVVTGRKYWSPVGSPVTVPHTGGHKQIVVYGSIARDGRRFFRTCDWFNANTSVEYLKAMQKHFGRVATVVDRVSPIEQNWSGSYCGKTRTSGSYTFQKDRRTSSGRGMLASGKASSARLRILQDLRRHAQCNLHVL